MNAERVQQTDDWGYGRERYNQTEAIQQYLEDMPSAQRKKKGKWIPHKLPNGEKSIDKDVCSRCRRRFYQIAETGCIWNYCPHCGAEMREQYKNKQSNCHKMPLPEPFKEAEE